MRPTNGHRPDAPRCCEIMSNTGKSPCNGRHFQYLFASPSGASKESRAVFYKVEGESLAASLCALFTTQYGAADRSHFHYMSAAMISTQERVLLDEALDWLQVYSDPDPGVYEPDPPKDVLKRAQYSNQADVWEQLLRQQLNDNQQSNRANRALDPSCTIKPDDLDPMPPEDRRNSALILLMLLAQAYYKLLESSISMATWFTMLDLELNHSYLWVTQNITNLLKNHEDLKDFPVQFEPLFPNLYPSTISDVEWQDIVAPDAEYFLSTVQQFVHSKGVYEPEHGSPAWTFLELFRPGVATAIDRAIAYEKRIHQHYQRTFGPSSTKLGVKGSSEAADPTSVQAAQQTQNGMSGQNSNRHRVSQLEELIDIEYEKLHEFEKAISLADGPSQKIALRQQIKRELTPRLRKLEKEYADSVATSNQVAALSEPEAEVLLAEIAGAVREANRKTHTQAPEEMLRLLAEIRNKLDEPGKSASAKLKLSLPIIPLISSYEMELDTEGLLTGVWRKLRNAFRGFNG
jgi:hypothetical protein